MSTRVSATYLVYLSLFSILSSTINASTGGSCQQPVYCSTDSSICTLYLHQSVTFICECVYKNCSTAWKSNNNSVHPISGPEYTLQVTEDIAGVMTCSNNSGIFSWTVTVLPSRPPKFVKPSQGHSFTNEITYIGNISNPTCIICVNCSVTGDPQAVVTWEYQTKPGVFNSVVTNQSNQTSPYYVEDNGQKLCYNNIRNYESVNGITYQCTACNIAGSIYATFTGKVDALYPLPEAGPLTTKGPVYSGGHNVTLKLYTHYQKESTFRACRYNRSSPHTLISCCNCDDSCEWGDLHCPDSGSPSCLLNTSHTGLYQFQIYTLNYPCFFNIGDPIDVNDIDNSSSSSHKSNDLILYIVISFLVGLLAIILLIGTGYCAYEHYRKQQRPQTPRVDIMDNIDDPDEVLVNRPLLPAAGRNYRSVNEPADIPAVPSTNTSTAPVDPSMQLESNVESDEKLPLQATDDDKTVPIPSTCKALAYYYRKIVYITHGNDSGQWVVDKLICFLVNLNVEVVRISDAIPGREYYSARLDFINQANKIILVISQQSIKDNAFLFDIARVLHKDSDPNEITIIPILYVNVAHSDIPEQIRHLTSISYVDPEFVTKITKSIYS